LYAHFSTLGGTTENAGVENAARSQRPGVENAGVEWYGKPLVLKLLALSKLYNYYCYYSAADCVV